MLVMIIPIGASRTQTAAWWSILLDHLRNWLKKRDWL